MPTSKHFERGILIVFAMWLAAILLTSWERTHRTIADTSAAVKVQEQTVIAAEQHTARVDGEDRQYRAAKQAQAQKLTAQTALAELQAHLPTAEIETEQSVITAELPEETREKLPASPGYLCLSDAQLKAVAADQLACDADRHSLAARESDVTDLKAELAARTAERDSWERAAKGGSRWRRVGRVLKYTGCAAAGAGAGALVSKQNPSAAAIGAAAAVTGCSLF